MALGPFPLDSGLPVAGGEASWAKPHGNWLLRAWQILRAAEDSGVTAARPTKNYELWVGRPYFDTTIGLPIWWNGSDWIDAAGNIV
jgi:hypothetical protein